MESLESAIAKFPRVILAHAPTPLEKMPRLSAKFAPHALYVKRDDCTGLAMGGNKARQLEFYLGDARARGCDTVLSTGAVQSNYMRMLAAAAARLNMECHAQLEERVANTSADYRHSGNVLLNKLFGARMHACPRADETGADAAVAARADELVARGKKPYVILLGIDHPPVGALGYALAAVELTRQLAQQKLQLDLIITGSGSGLTHAGLLVGLKLAGAAIAVLGVCVRRGAAQQHSRVLSHCAQLGRMLGAPNAVSADEVQVDDRALPPGYGRAAAQVVGDMRLLAATEGLLTDPVYSGKTFSCALQLIRAGELTQFKRIAILHTGGVPALFAARDEF